jgi:hypothetical protein
VERVICGVERLMCPACAVSADDMGTNNCWIRPFGGCSCDACKPDHCRWWGVPTADSLLAAGRAAQECAAAVSSRQLGLYITRFQVSSSSCQSADQVAFVCHQIILLLLNDIGQCRAIAQIMKCNWFK